MLAIAYIVCLLILVGMALGGAAIVWGRRPIPGARSLAALMLAVATWALCDALSALSPSRELAHFFESRLRFAAVAASYVALLAVALEYTGHYQWLSRRRLLLLCIVPIWTQLVIWLGPDDAFLAEVTYVRVDGLYLPDEREFGPWFNLHLFYGYCLIASAVLLLLHRMLRAQYPYRGQAGLLLGGVLLLVTISVGRSFGSGPILRYDWIVISFAGAAILWTFALFQYGLLNVAPIARSALIDDMDDLVIVLDAQDRIVDFNPAAGRRLGWGRATVIGRPAETILSDWQADILHRYDGVQRAAAELTVGQRTFDLRVTALQRWRDHPVGRLFALREITDRKRVEDEVLQREAEARAFQRKLVELHDITVELAQIDDLWTLYRRAIELAHDRLGFERVGLFMVDQGDPSMIHGTYGVDLQGQVRDEHHERSTIASNVHIREALEAKERYKVLENVDLWDQREIVGHGWNALATVWDGAEGFGWLVTDNAITGAPRPGYLLELMALYGRTLGYLITNLRAREQAMQLAMERERVEALSSFIAAASHEFRTPLAIIGTSSYLLAQQNEDDRTRRVREGIQVQVDRMAQLVDSLGLMASLDSGAAFDQEPVDLNQLMRTMASAHRDELTAAQLTLTLDLSEDLPPLTGDGDFLRQAFDEIIGNAIRFTKPGGVITLRTTHDGQHLVVQIIDTGVGMTEEQRGRAFERFYRVDKARTTPGFGLGLSIAKSIVEGHGGSILVRSVINAGSQIEVRLPLSS